jgi:transcriptional regulator with XRE-family HTH domain
VLSDVAAEQITRRRKELGWNREKLAQECTALGMPSLTAASLTNIESGRRQDGVRRRQLTIDELVVLACALRIPVPLLLAPYGQTETAELLPDLSVPTWASARWVAGDHPDSWSAVASFVLQAGDVEQWFDAAGPLLALRRHDQLVAQRVTAGARLLRVNRIHPAFSQQPEPSELRVKEITQQIEDADDALIEWRNRMRDRELPLPTLPHGMEYLDQA